MHADGKHFESFEYQAVVLQNESKEIKLAALKLKDGKSQTIAGGIQNVLDEFNMCVSIVMIVGDTTIVNTGKTTEVVVRLHNQVHQLPAPCVGSRSLRYHGQ